MTVDSYRGQSRNAIVKMVCQLAKVKNEMG